MQLQGFLLFFCVGLSLYSQEDDLVKGLRMKVAGPSGAVDVRSVPRLSLAVESGSSATPFVEPGEFKARWEGFLHLESRSRIYFSLSGSGKALLSIGEEEVLSVEGEDFSTTESERLRLNSGDHKLVLEYDSPSDGVGSIRLYWRGRDFARETIPTTAFRRDAGSPEGDVLREGRALFADSGCIHCHAISNLNLANGMPELAQQAPQFQGIGSRLNKDWIARWVANPKHLRPSARMPSLLGLESAESALTTKDSRPWDIAAFLAEQTNDTPKPLADYSDVMVGDGRKLFYSLGCIGCHKLEQEPETTKDLDRIDLSSVGQKFRDGALRDFLRKPWEHYDWIRMPDFGLSLQEATQLAAYLRSESHGSLLEGLPGDTEKGEKLILSLGCANCHKIPSNKFHEGLTLANIRNSPDQGCLAKDTGIAPDYDFSEQERSYLSNFLRKGIHSLKRNSSAEFAERQMIALNCNACHSMQGIQNDLSVLPNLTSHDKLNIADTEAEVEAAGRKKDPPDLTYTGEKLRADWLTKLLTGTLDYKPRPWMQMRMPAFPSRGKHLAQGLANLHGMPKVSKVPSFEPSWKALGQKLISPNGGFGCVACHAVGEKPALAPFEGQGLNFTYSRDRLNHEFYLRWMLNPQRINPHSIMPRYADEEGITALTETLGGNGVNQFNAIWHYLIRGKF